MVKRVEKPWGHEEIWAETADYVGKVLVIKQGHRLSLQHHIVKEETIRIASGIMELELESAEGVLESHTLHPGESHHIAPGRRHRMYAVTDCEVYEVSTPHLSDVVRHQDDYGRA
ncbi:MAG: mannose-6-phosphate isomerase [Myxococcota bacterium]|jgi:mannose-6-phosphate isomerase